MAADHVRGKISPQGISYTRATSAWRANGTQQIDQKHSNRSSIDSTATDMAKSLSLLWYAGVVLISRQLFWTTAIEHRIETRAEADPQQCPIFWNPATPAVLPEHASWVGRYCNRHKHGQGPVILWFDLCFTRPGRAAPWLVGDTAKQTLQNGLGPALGYDPQEFEPGPFNAVRLPTQRSSRVSRFGRCPDGYECLQSTDAERDSHIHCLRNFRMTELHIPGVPDYMRFTGVGEVPYEPIDLFPPGLLQVVDDSDDESLTEGSTSAARGGLSGSSSF